ncbi:hypothetical protein ACOJCM_16285 [Billgrantia sp. LNSP4103-1]|uniref:hypothetical protein n=1 Tax=Billgrantia sp. LNSP4103-1 TaxID=3410266 RepID=UPI00403F796A
MTERHTSLSARELLDILMPKLKATEHFLADTLEVKIQSCLDPREKLRLNKLKVEFELELGMIRMNLDHLLRRFSKEFIAVQQGLEDASLALDEHETVAIESIRRLYAQAHGYQTDRGGMSNE